VLVLLFFRFFSISIVIAQMLGVETPMILRDSPESPTCQPDRLQSVWREGRGKCHDFQVVAFQKDKKT
jgi:hypothetical protein